MSWKGIDIRQSGNRIVFRASLKTSAGAIVSSGTATLRIFEVQEDGTLKSYDFNDNTFKTTALTTPTVNMVHRTGNNGTYNSGIWTYSLTTVVGFTRGSIYIAQINHASAVPIEQEREFQYGEGEGDFSLDASGRVDISKVLGAAINALVSGRVDANVGAISTDISAANNLKFILNGTGGVVVKMKQLDIQNPDGHAFIAQSTEPTSDGIRAIGGLSGRGIYADGINGILAEGDGDGIKTQSLVEGNGINAIGSGVAGSGFRAAGGGGHGLVAIKGASGKDIDSDQTDNLDATVSSRATDVGVWAVGSRTLTSFGTLVSDIWHHLLASITTAGSIGKLLKDNVDGQISRLINALVPKTGSVVADGANTATTFKTGLSETANDFWKGHILVITSGALAGQSQIVASYNGTTKFISFNTGFTSAPAADVSFALVPIKTGSTSQIGAFSITVTVKNASTLATLQDILVTVKDSGETTILDQKRTNSSGQAVFSLDTGTYKISITTPPGYSSLASQTLVVSANASVTYNLTPITPSAPAAPGLCVVQFYVRKSAGGSLLQGATCKARLADRNAIASNNLISMQVNSVTTDVNGYAELQLIKKGQFESVSDGSDGTYIFEITDPNGDVIASSISKIPDQDSALFDDLVTSPVS